MSPEIVTTAAERVIDQQVLGALCVLLAAGCVGLLALYVRRQDSCRRELAELTAAHRADMTRYWEQYTADLEKWMTKTHDVVENTNRWAEAIARRITR